MNLYDHLERGEAIRALAAQVAANSSGEKDVTVLALLRKAAQIENYIRTGSTSAQY